MTNTSYLKAEIDQAFGGNLTSRQIWALVKLSKHVRMRCRNNAAFNNCFSSLFPHASFRQVMKIKQDGTTYPGLQIAINGVVEDVGTEEDTD